MAPEILAHLQEHSSRGFLLFTTSMNGTIDCYCHVDDEITKQALQTHALQLLSAQQEIDSQMLFNGLISSMEAEMKAAAKPKRRKKGGDDNTPA